MSFINSAVNTVYTTVSIVLLVAMEVILVNHWVFKMPLPF